LVTALVLLASQPRALFGVRKLPPTVNAVFYMRLKPAYASMVARLDAGDNTNVPGAIKLLHKWCRDCQTDDVLRGCLKLIGLGRNFAEVKSAHDFTPQFGGCLTEGGRCMSAWTDGFFP
jgi:hypothetical protein